MGTINVLTVSDVMDEVNLNGDTCQRALICPTELEAIAKVQSYFYYVHFSSDPDVEAISQHFILSLATFSSANGFIIDE